MKSIAQTVIEADRFYTIAAKTGSVIQAVENAKDGGDIRLGKYDHKPEQEWAFIRVGDGVYRIRNRANGKLMDLMMTGTANGTWLHLWEDVGGTSQMWTMEHTPQGTVRLRSSWAGGKCIDTVGMGTADGAVLQIWQETAGEDQLWTIEEVKDRAKRAVKKAEPAVEAAPAAEPVKTETAPVGEEKAAEPVAAPAVEEKPEVKEEAKTEEKPAEEKTGFTDVKDTDWFKADVEAAVELGLMTGTSATTFDPKGVTTRAMVVATLYRLAGSPEVTEKAAFTDVVSGSYYEAAVAWAARNAIASGTSETTFEPNKAVTREQLAKFLFNYAVYQGMDAVTLSENLSSFSDQAEISAYAVSALQWAVGAELIKGSDGKLQPAGTATRCQFAAILNRFAATQKNA